MASDEKEVLCQFKLRRTTLYPPRYDECGGEFVAIEDCQETEKETGYSESYLILLRSGHLKEYDKNEGWNICEKHRRLYGLQFLREFKQKKCHFPNHGGNPSKAKLDYILSLHHSKGLLYQENMIMPYGIKICQKCNREIGSLLMNYKEEDEMDSQELSEPSSSQTPSSGKSWRPQLDLGHSDNEDSTDDETTQEKNPRKMVIDLIRTIEPSFHKDKKNKQAMWTAQKPLHKLHKQATLKMKKTVGLTIKAAIMALSNCPEDHPEIWNLVKDSRIVEKELGQKALMDSYIKEIIIAHNKVTTDQQRTQIISLVAKKLGFSQLKKFNPPVQKENPDMDIGNFTTPKGSVILAQSEDCVVGAASPGVSETTNKEYESEEKEDDDEEEENMDAGGDTNELKNSKKIYWNPKLTWDRYKNSRVHYDKFQAGGQPVEVTTKPRERIKKEVIRTIIDFFNQ